MADKEKDLELKIGADIDAFLEEMAMLDEKYQEIVKKIENKKAEVKLKTTMDISEARAIGDVTAEIVARNKEIEELIKLQQAKTETLKKAWDELKDSQEASEQQVKKAAQTYAKAQIELNKLYARQRTEQQKAAERAAKEQEKIAKIAENQKEQKVNLLVGDVAKQLADIEVEYNKYIAIAKAAGDVEKTHDMQMRKLVQTYNAHFQAAGKIAKAYQEEVNASGVSSAQSQKLRTELSKQITAYKNVQIAINDYKKKLKSDGKEIVPKASFDSMKTLSVLAPQVAYKIDYLKRSLGTLSEAVPGLSGIAQSLAPAVGAFGAATVAAGAFYKALQHVVTESEEMAKKSTEIGESIYKMKERLSMDEKSANLLNDIFTLDGTDANAVLKKLDSLGASLLNSSEEGTKASRAIERYGETLLNADGSLKKYEDMLQAVANAWKKAEESGQGYQVLAETGLGRFSTLIASWDDLVKRANGVEQTLGATTKSAHATADAIANLNLQIQKEQQQRGAEGSAVYLKVLEKRKQLYAESQRYEKEHNNEIRIAEERIGTFTTFVDKLGNSWDMTFTKAKANLGSLIQTFDKLPGNKAFRESFIGLFGLEDIKVDTALDRELAQKQEDAQKKAQAERAKQEQAEAERRARTAKANAALEKMIWESKASDYDKEIAKLNEVAEEKKKEGADELKIQEYVASEKAKIDQKYEEKARKEAEAKQNSANQAVERAKKEAEARLQATRQASEQIQNVFRTETQRRIAEIEKQKQAWIKAGADELQATLAAEKQKREARMSEAERTMRENIKLIKLMQKEEAKGGDWEARVMAKKDKWYLKDMGANMGDVAALQRYGLDLVNKLADSKSRIFGGFAGSEVNNINNNTTVNIDRPVFTDETLVNMLLERLTDKLVPVMKQAFGNEVSNSIG